MNVELMLLLEIQWLTIVEKMGIYCTIHKGRVPPLKECNFCPEFLYRVKAYSNKCPPWSEPHMANEVHLLWNAQLQTLYMHLSLKPLIGFTPLRWHWNSLKVITKSLDVDNAATVQSANYTMLSHMLPFRVLFAASTWLWQLVAPLYILDCPVVCSKGIQ